MSSSKRKKFPLSIEFLERLSRDKVPEKAKAYLKETGMFQHELLHNALFKSFNGEAYYGGSKQISKERISRILNGKRNMLTREPLELMAENMDMSASELLWGEEEEWKHFLPAFFNLVVFESLNNALAGNLEKGLDNKVTNVLLESVSFSREYAQFIIENDFKNDPIWFSFFNKNMTQAIYRLYQKDVEEKFYQLFKKYFVSSSYRLGKLDSKVQEFVKELWQSVLAGYGVDKNSLGHQVYKTYDIFFSHESREYRASLPIKGDERFSGLNLEYYLEKEQKQIYEAVKVLVDTLEGVQQEQDKLLGYRTNKKELFTAGLAAVHFDEAFFEEYEKEEEAPAVMTEEELNAAIKKAIKDGTLPI